MVIIFEFLVAYQLSEMLIASYTRSGRYMRCENRELS